MTNPTQPDERQHEYKPPFLVRGKPVEGKCFTCGQPRAAAVHGGGDGPAERRCANHCEHDPNLMHDGHCTAPHFGGGDCWHVCTFTSPAGEGDATR